MPSSSPQLEWCVVRLGEDLNWWVSEISDEIHWDTDGLGILDPRQVQHLLELCEPLRDYGFTNDVFDDAFFTFRIERDLGDGRVRLVRTRETLSEAEDPLFALPDILDEERGPYADFLDQVTRFRVKMLNDLIEFESKLTIDELEEEIRERQNTDFIEGRATHFFQEMTAILEYVPDGYELDVAEEEGASAAEDEIEDFGDLGDDEEIEKDETMRWDDDEEEEEDDDDSPEAKKGEGDEEDGESEDEDEEEAEDEADESPRRRRR